ncbi:hypothetical protein JKF63_05298 [Porcisia hertigi]|uniref:Flagellar calcium-binding protein EF-hand domain-containing protein n=1 Tax=Porcisia hertigi TaxID=2761500 RepID=A0A836IB58_9TRYP|nr:hypothetical protein JKF63_05298 [Porcisia hertigi]
MGFLNDMKPDSFTTRLQGILSCALDEARNMDNTVSGGGECLGYLECFEFRLMSCYIYDYFELIVMFDKLYIPLATA